MIDKTADVEADRLCKALDLAQARFKMVSDLGMKGIVFHLGISAFSLTFGFQNKGVPIRVILGADVLITVMALLATVVIARDAERVRRQIVRWHHDLRITIDEGELRGIITTGRLYAVLCVIVLGFWIWLMFSTGRVVTTAA